MELPEKQPNLEAGTFMVNLTFYTTKNHFLDTSARPVSHTHHSEGHQYFPDMFPLHPPYNLFLHEASPGTCVTM